MLVVKQHHTIDTETHKAAVKVTDTAGGEGSLTGGKKFAIGSKSFITTSDT